MPSNSTAVGWFTFPAVVNYSGTDVAKIVEARAALAAEYEAARVLLHTLGVAYEDMTEPEFQGFGDRGEWRIYGDSHRGRLFVSLFDRPALTVAR